MTIQSNLKNLNLQYRKVKEDAKNLMLRGDLKNYVRKLVRITTIETEFNDLSRQMKAA